MAADQGNLTLTVHDREVPLSLLDLATVPSGSTHAEALRRSVRTARHAERLGFHRFWVAEHHNMPQIASSAPDLLMAHAACGTSSIRIGSGGVMLPNHSPLVVAERFAMLEALHPGRIDLGIGRAPGTDPRTAAALRRDTSALTAEGFLEQLEDVRGHISGFPDGHPKAGLRAVPGGPELMPPMWLLGSSDFSAQVAAALGQRFAFAHHFASANTVPAMRLYRERFRPSGDLPRPYAMVTVTVICADTDEEAERQSLSLQLAIVRLRQGRPAELASPDEAAAHDWSDLERRHAASFLADQVVGSPATVRRKLTELVERTDAQEVMVSGQLHDEEAHLHGLELLAASTRDDG